MDSILLLTSEFFPLSPLHDAGLTRRIPLLPFRLSGSTTGSVSSTSRSFQLAGKNGGLHAVRRCRSTSVMASCTHSENGVLTVGDFMTKKENLQVVKPSTTVEEALENLVENRITGFPVIDDNWKLVGVVSDYDLLALDSISGSVSTDSSMFPEVGSTWKVFNELQKLLGKTNGKLIADVMTQVPLVVRETTNLEDAARLLLETRYRRLPVVDADEKLVGIITRGDVIRAALQIKRDVEKGTL